MTIIDSSARNFIPDTKQPESKKNSDKAPAAKNKAESNQAMGADRKQLSPENFITLFINQLTHQNPLHPADSSTILQQMADISMISASNSTQETLKDVQKNVNLALGNSQFVTATQLIGKRVEIPSASSQLVKYEGLSGSVMLPKAASDIQVVIKNEKNEIVKKLNLDPTSSGGLVDFSWDGMDEEGKIAYENGFYKISATATVDGKQMPIDTLGAFKVRSIAANHATGDVILNVDGLGGLGVKDIVKIV